MARSCFVILGLLSQNFRSWPVSIVHLNPEPCEIPRSGHSISSTSLEIVSSPSICPIRIKAHVDHVIPGEGFINWSAMCHKLRLAHYTGPILMEVMTAHSRFQDPALFLREAQMVAHKTWEMIHGGG
jgi:hypothetical protein